MRVTAAVLEELFSEPIVPLRYYGTVKPQNVRKIIVNGLTHFSNEEHDHGHACILKLRDSFRLRCNMSNSKLQEPPARPDKAMTGINF